MPGPPIVIAGSISEYGSQKGWLREGMPCMPDDPYGASKLAATIAACAYAATYRMNVVVTRCGSITGPGARAGSIIARLARAQAETLPAPEGNPDVWLDVTGIADMVSAWILASRLQPGIYNVCSGKPASLDRIARLLAGLPAPAETGAPSVASPGKFAAATGWAPRVSLEDTLKDVLEDWRQRCAT
jgi:GDP-4-dehydro-6-deoxy-D-mannose reductase